MAIFSTAPPPQPILPLRRRAPLPSTSLAARSFVCSSSSSTSSSTSAAEDKSPPPPSADLAAVPPDSDLSLSGCKGCGKEEIESGCNGEGRIQGGIATFPGLGWWPIKAYRPCPGFLASGGRYKRQGQSMDEVVSGGANKARASAMKYNSIDDETVPRKKGKDRRVFKS